MKSKQLTRRQVAGIAASLDRRLEDTQALLAAVVLQYGRDGQLAVSGEHLESVGRLAADRTLAVRVMSNGDMRVDFAEPQKPELEMTVEEAPCLST